LLCGGGFAWTTQFRNKKHTHTHTHTHIGSLKMTAFVVQFYHFAAAATTVSHHRFGSALRRERQTRSRRSALSGRASHARFYTRPGASGTHTQRGLTVVSRRVHDACRRRRWLGVHGGRVDVEVFGLK